VVGAGRRGCVAVAVVGSSRVIYNIIPTILFPVDFTRRAEHNNIIMTPLCIELIMRTHI